MQRRRLGDTGLSIAPLVFGGNVLGWTVDEKTAFTLLDAFTEAGFNAIDTADVYSIWVPGHQGGESETILGKWLKRPGNRAKVVIATKVGMDMGPERSGLSRDYILRAVEDSLKRLGTEVIDLYFGHIDDPGTPLEETLAAFDSLLTQGKVRAIGASNYGGRRLAEALEASRRAGLPAYQVMQPLYNLYDRAEYEVELEAVCRQAGLGVVTYFSLASGFLTGKYRSMADVAGSARGGFVRKYLNERGRKIISALDDVAGSLGATMGQVALAWILANDSVTAPIASATSLEQLIDLMGAVELALPAEAKAALDAASAYGRAPEKAEA